jgi:hypothetical protein
MVLFKGELQAVPVKTVHKLVLLKIPKNDINQQKPITKS